MPSSPNLIVEALDIELAIAAFCLIPKIFQFALEQKSLKNTKLKTKRVKWNISKNRTRFK